MPEPPRQAPADPQTDSQNYRAPRGPSRPCSCLAYLLLLFSELVFPKLFIKPPRGKEQSGRRSRFFKRLQRAARRSAGASERDPLAKFPRVRRSAPTRASAVPPGLAASRPEHIFRPSVLNAKNYRDKFILFDDMTFINDF